MFIRLLICLPLLVNLFISCVAGTDERVIKVSTGTSFGECLGYCSRTMEISKESLSYVATGTDAASYPPRAMQTELSDAEWKQLVDLIDLDNLKSYEDVIGCPDCADGGAEFIKVEMTEGTKQITFEYGDSLGTIQPLVEHLRALRARYESSVFDK